MVLARSLIKATLTVEAIRAPMVRHTGTTKGTETDGGTATQTMTVQDVEGAMTMCTDKWYVWHMAGAVEWSQHTALAEFWHFGDGEGYGNGNGRGDSVRVRLPITKGDGYVY